MQLVVLTQDISLHLIQDSTPSNLLYLKTVRGGMPVLCICTIHFYPTPTFYNGKRVPASILGQPIPLCPAPCTLVLTRDLTLALILSPES